MDQLRKASAPGTYREPRARYYLDAIYYLIKSLDDAPLVISDDGWLHATTDLVTIHDYTQDPTALREDYLAFKEDRHCRSFTHRLPIFLSEYDYEGRPIVMTEYGGSKVEEQGAEGWGYGTSAKDYDEMLELIVT